MNTDQFWAALTNRRDQAMAHLVDVIERSGPDEFIYFVSKNIMPIIADNSKSELREDMARYLIGHMAMVGAFEALLAHRDKQSEL